MKRTVADRSARAANRGHAIRSAVANLLSAPDTAAVPKGFTVTTTDTGTTIRYRWFRGKYVVMVLWVAGFTAAALQIQHPQAYEVAISVVIIGGLAYYTLAGLVNATRIAVDTEAIVVRHGPLPFVRGRRVAAAAIQSLSSNMPADAPSMDYSVRFSDFRLYATLKTGKRQLLVSGLTKPAHADFIARIVRLYSQAPGGYRPGQ